MEQAKKLRLPPVDIYRAPFVEPIGHLAMQASKAEQLVFDLCAAIPFDGSPDQLHPGTAEQKCRNWTPKAEEFITERLALLSHEETRQAAATAINTFLQIKDFRNRVIHDAVEVGIDFDGKAFALAVQYHRDGKNPSEVYLHRVTPEQIAHLACEFYELCKDLETVIHTVRHGSIDRME
jgi:hypothetical protein